MESDTESVSRFVSSRCLWERHDRTEEVNVITVGLSSCTDDDLGTRHVIETVSDVSWGGNDCPNDAPPQGRPFVRLNHELVPRGVL
jgi:hypothetical protein